MLWMQTCCGFLEDQTELKIAIIFSSSAITSIKTLSLHDALPISSRASAATAGRLAPSPSTASARATAVHSRSEEHTSELQSRRELVCRLLLEKKKLDADHLAIIFSQDVLWVAATGGTSYNHGSEIITGRSLGEDVMDANLLWVFGGPDGTKNSYYF